MGYTPPSLRELIQRVKIIKEKYANDNPKRDQLLALLDIIHTGINQIYLSDPQIKESDLQKICLGALVFCLEEIQSEKKYKILNPEFKKGYFFNSGSTLYTLIQEQLDINETNIIDDKLRLIFLEKFYNFGFNNQYTSAYSQLEPPKTNEIQLNSKVIEKKLISVITTVLTRLTDHITGLIHATPSEKAIDLNLLYLLEDYQKEKMSAQNKAVFFSRTPQSNAGRKYHAELAAAITGIVIAQEEQVNPVNQETSDKISENKELIEPDILSHSQRIKMGALLYVMHCIQNEYYLRSPRNSVLFTLGCKYLNIERLSDLNPHIQLNCILAFKSFLKDSSTALALEKYGKEHFHDENFLKEIDPKIYEIKKNLKKIIIALLDASVKVNWPATKTLSKVGGVIMAAPGYGLGWVVGDLAGESNHTVNTKVSLSEYMNTMSAAVVGRSGRHWGFLASDIIIKSMLGRVFAQLFEQFGKLIGTITFGTIGFGFDLTYKTFRNLGQGYLFVHSNLQDPALTQDADYEFVESLLNLPEKIFSPERKVKLVELRDGIIKPSSDPENEPKQLSLV